MPVFDFMKVLRMDEGERPTEPGWYLAKFRSTHSTPLNFVSVSHYSGGLYVFLPGIHTAMGLETFDFVAQIFPKEITDNGLIERLKAEIV